MLAFAYQFCLKYYQSFKGLDQWLTNFAYLPAIFEPLKDPIGHMNAKFKSRNKKKTINLMI